MIPDYGALDIKSLKPLNLLAFRGLFEKWGQIGAFLVFRTKYLRKVFHFDPDFDFLIGSWVISGSTDPGMLILIGFKQPESGTLRRTIRTCINFYSFN